MGGSGSQNTPLWATPGRLDTAFPPFTQMKGEDQPKPFEAAQILNDFFIQPIIKFEGGDRKIPGFSAFHHRALVGCINAAGIG